MNVWTGIGRVVNDCEVKKTNDGTSVCTFSLAVKKDEKVKEGEKDAWFVDCVAWNKKADYLGMYAKKGDAVSVTGSLRFKQYDSKGTKVKTVECICDRVQIVAKQSKEQKPQNDFKSYEGFDNLGKQVVTGDELPF